MIVEDISWKIARIEERTTASPAQIIMSAGVFYDMLSEMDTPPLARSIDSGQDGRLYGIPVGIDPVPYYRLEVREQKESA